MQLGADFLLLRYDSPLRFPLLDAYPQIYPQIAGQPDVGVQTTLSTNSSMVRRIRHLRSEATRLVGVNEREDLSNGLAELADAYQEGWLSGSDEDDDDIQIMSIFTTEGVKAKDWLKEAH
ncbi:hypothetical protein NM208_g15433 [Fusarium decemcellulare]|uniref:Uncharacterized protein n=1 Tax=Fusarium decemcellulare TaxID=57161 RepID=A0ACC1RD52_9HYPO|nr:hypothetical protein NM208_g15433 [Fusarium decemcellulare]